MKTFHLASLAAALLAASLNSSACKGISLESTGSDKIVARTIEWGASVLNSNIVVVPRGHQSETQTAYGPGMQYNNTLCYVGLSIEDKSFVVEGLNEKGLSAGLFFFPGYGTYPTYDRALKQQTLSDMDFVAWVLGNAESVKSAK